MAKQIDRRSQILEIAQNDENIRGIFLYGSKANNEVRPDIYQDFDIYYIAENIDEIIFAGTCSEFLWELQNVAKGIKRDELSYTMFIRDIGVRDMLNKIIDAYIEMTNNSATVGTLGKYRKKYLSETQYSTYKMTYLSNNPEDIWKSIFYMLELFEELGIYIASHYGYKYPESEVRYVRDYLIRVRDR